MLPTEAEFVVVGGGLLGLSTAWHLTRRGREVVVLEGSEVGHARSGSKGECRIFRLGYDDPRYVAMARAALPMWRELEVESGLSLLRTTGQLTVGPSLDVLTAALDEAGAPWELWPEEEVGRRFPHVASGGPAVFEPESGVLSASRTLAALRQGIEVFEGTKVLGFTEEPGSLQVETTGGAIRAAHVVCCAGAWNQPVLAAAGVDLALRVTAEQVAYFSAPAAIPILVERGPSMFYGLPTPDTGLYKAGRHHAGPVSDPRVVMTPDPAEDEVLAAILGRLVPGISPVWSERCLYDNTPDEDFVIDRVGRVTIGAGTSGHGFKFGPLLGELLADLAEGATPRLDIGWVGIQRAALVVGE